MKFHYSNEYSLPCFPLFKNLYGTTFVSALKKIEYSVGNVMARGGGIFEIEEGGVENKFIKILLTLARFKDVN
jgi:hypothetical protein